MTQDEAYQVITLIAKDLVPEKSGSLAILDGINQQLEVVRWGTEMIIESAFSLEECCGGGRRGRLHVVLDPQEGLMCRHFSHPP